MIAPWLQLKRLVGRPTATADHEGQVRYDRDGAEDGTLYLARMVSTGAFEWQSLSATTRHTFALPPFYINDLPATATTEAKLIFYDTSTSSSINTTRRIKMSKAGVVVGAIITSDVACTNGTATVKVLVNSTGTDFLSGGVRLDTSDTTSLSGFATAAEGVPFAATNTLGVQVETSGWAPTTANVWVSLVVQLTAFD